MGIEYAIIVKNKTRLEQLIERFNTKAQAKFYIERLGGNFEDYIKEDEIFKRSLNTLQTQLTKVLKNKTVEREYLPSYIFAENNLIVVIGQDGLVANTAKYSNGQPIVAINPDKTRYDGVLLPFDTNNFIQGVEQVLDKKYQSRTIRFAEAKLNDGQKLLGFNDLFIGAASHVSARYKISFNHSSEEHSSSGLIVSTKAGSTGWLSSIFNMAYGITDLFDNSPKRKNTMKSSVSKTKKGKVMPQETRQRPNLQDNELLFAVREPFKSVRTQTNIVAGIIKSENKLQVESYMPSNGVIFSDGIEKDFLRFNSGSIVNIGIADEKANLVMNRKI